MAGQRVEAFGRWELIDDGIRLDQTQRGTALTVDEQRLHT